VNQVSESNRKLHAGFWVILVTVLGIAILLLVGPMTDWVQARRLSKKLYASDSTEQKEAVEQMVSYGPSCRAALVEALGPDNGGDTLRRDLIEALHKEIETGGDIKPIVRAAAEALHRGGPGVRNCAYVAAEGWPLGLLDDQTKVEVAKQLLELKLEARPEYPLGRVRPIFTGGCKANESTPLRFSARISFLVDGQTARSYKLEFGDGSDRKTYDTPENMSDLNKLGRHTLKGKAEIELVDIVTGGRFEAVEQPGWKMSLETPEMMITVRDDLPADYLQAKVTPELQKKVAESVVTEIAVPHYNSAIYSWRLGENKQVTFRGSRQFSVAPPFPVDLAFNTRWKNLETGKAWITNGHVVLEGSKALFAGSPPEGIADGLPAGKHKRSEEHTSELQSRHR
jgi:hypothetical protein